MCGGGYRDAGLRLALSKLRCGWPVRRRGWNGKGIFIKLQVPDEHSKA